MFNSLISTLRNRIFTHSCNDLLPYQRVYTLVAQSERKSLGIPSVTLHDIIGSTGRSKDYDLQFIPLRTEKGERWQRIMDAYQQNVTLPPIHLYKIGDRYFIEDGNHRVSVANALERQEINAYVTEISTESLKPNSNCTRLGYDIRR